MNKYIDLKPKNQKKQGHCTVRSNISHNVSFVRVRAKTPPAKPKPVVKLFNIPIFINCKHFIISACQKNKKPTALRRLANGGTSIDRQITSSQTYSNYTNLTQIVNNILECQGRSKWFGVNCTSRSLTCKRFLQTLNIYKGLTILVILSLPVSNLENHFKLINIVKFSWVSEKYN